MKELLTSPAVFAVENTYQIMVPVRNEMLFWVEVGGEKFYDNSNGILRSDTLIHRVSVPMDKLDKAGGYTVCYKNIIERKPYHPETQETKSETYRFYPVKKDGKINIYHISDSHGEYALPAKTGAYFGEDIDLLILNGDIIDHSGDVKNFELIFRLCEAVTHGEHPCVFSRGNHDLRGFCAEQLADYTPCFNGKSYYTFRLGKIWGMVLDCGEDKSDSHPEYGGTVCCSSFRREETEFLKVVAEKREYLSYGIKYRLVIVHNPFTFTLEPPFDIEQELYKRWTDILKEEIKPDLIISGHLHDACVSDIGGELDSKGQPCPVIIGSKFTEDDSDFIGCALTLDGDEMNVCFPNSENRIVNSKTLKKAMR